MLYVSVSEILKDSDYHLAVSLLAGKGGLKKRIHIPRIQRPGLALTGDLSHLHPGRIQVLGKSEIRYLNSLSAPELERICRKICGVDLACMVVTRGQQVPKPLLDACEEFSVPLLQSEHITYTFINHIAKFLEDRLTATISMHGVLMDVFAVGMLITGKSGIGKSECALDLILRGHRLVADDVVEIKKKPPSTLYGMSTKLIKHHMEIRGLGILNIKDLFGVAAIRDQKLIEIVVELVEWNPKEEYDRLGVDEQKYNLLEVQVPYLKVPVRPGRNVTTLIEVAARNHLLKLRGHFSAKEFEENLNQELSEDSEDQAVPIDRWTFPE